MIKTNKKGFTLIEMAIVLLIIGILAGFLLTNLGGQTVTARDTRRIGDMRNVAAYLANYFSKKSYFPATTTWDNLEAELRKEKVVVKLPRDPVKARSYQYYPCSSVTTTVNATTAVDHFILKASLEQSSSTAPALYDSSYNSTTTPDGWQGCWVNGMGVQAATSLVGICNGSNDYCLIQ